MPEGPEVYITSLELDAALKGKILQSIIIKERCFNFDSINTLLPAKILGVKSKGKKLLFYFRTLAISKSFIIGSALGMEGHWGYEENKHIKLSLGFNDLNLYYNDSRKFGLNQLILNQEEYTDFLKAVGIDLIRERDKITPEKWKEILTNPRIKNKKICDFLLEQHRIAGIGNYLRAEILYRSKISPHRTLGQIKEEELEVLRTNTLSTIDDATKGNGLTIATYKTPSGILGTFECQVYGKAKDPEGNIITKEKVAGGRSIHWSPIAQK